MFAPRHASGRIKSGMTLVLDASVVVTPASEPGSRKCNFSLLIRLGSLFPRNLWFGSVIKAFHTEHFFPDISKHPRM